MAEAITTYGSDLGQGICEQAGRCETVRTVLNMALAQCEEDLKGEHEPALLLFRTALNELESVQDALNGLELHHCRGRAETA